MPTHTNYIHRFYFFVYSCEFFNKLFYGLNKHLTISRGHFHFQLRCLTSGNCIHFQLSKFVVNFSTLDCLAYLYKTHKLNLNTEALTIFHKLHRRKNHTSYYILFLLYLHNRLTYSRRSFPFIFKDE